MQKTVYLESIDSEIVLARRRGTRSLRLTMRNDGSIRLSVPYGISDSQALKFLHSKSDWIEKHRRPLTVLKTGDHIGKSWRLYFMQGTSQKTTTRLKENTIIVNIGSGASQTSDVVQKAAKRACERALTKEADNLLPKRLKDLALKHGITYKSCRVKKLKSRWGSCDNHKNIVLNIFLTQLPWDLIDYVLLHELAHTHHQHHQKEFWDFLSQIEPNYKEKRKTLKSMSTDIMPTSY